MLQKQEAIVIALDPLKKERDQFQVRHDNLRHNIEWNENVIERINNQVSENKIQRDSITAKLKSAAEKEQAVREARESG
ncbi:hypothetical protein MMC08_007586 [Hypocenomyce scalaris]|nr:hypothetical protein [Hypocenomyce scalaris]